MTSSTALTNMDPRLRIQVLFENLVGNPTKEFKAGLLTEPSFAALRSHIMTLLPDDEQDKDQMSFKYRIEERHGSRWVSFQDTEGLGYAIESRNQDKDYVFIAVVNENKAAAAVPSPVVSHSTTTTTKAKAKVVLANLNRVSAIPNRPHLQKAHKMTVDIYFLFFTFCRHTSTYGLCSLDITFCSSCPVDIPIITASISCMCTTTFCQFILLLSGGGRSDGSHCRGGRGSDETIVKTAFSL
jgi:hypothetical protein